MKKNTVSKFVILAYLFGFIPQLLYFFHRDQKMWLNVAMWAPALAVLFCGPEARSLAKDSLKQAGWKFFGYAFLIGVGVYGLSQLIWFFTATGSLNPNMTGSRYLLVLAVNPVLTGLLGALGEEIGWRGFLQPALRKDNGALKTYFLIGLIWAYWHLPVNLAGHNGVDFPILNSFVIFPLSLIFMNFVFGWIRDRSHSVWPSVYFHGVVNSVANGWIILPNTEWVEKITTTSLWVAIGLVWILIITKKAKSSE